MVLKESERALVAKLDVFAQTQYPELQVQSALNFERKGIKVAQQSKLSQYGGLTAVSADTFLSSTATGEKFVVKKFPIPAKEKREYCERMCTFLHK